MSPTSETVEVRREPLKRLMELVEQAIRRHGRTANGWEALASALTKVERDIAEADLNLRLETALPDLPETDRS